MPHVPCRILLGGLFISRNYPGLLTTSLEMQTNLEMKMPGAKPGISIFSSVSRSCEMIFSSRTAARLVACNAHRDAHATADAQSGETLLGIALLHFVQ